MYCRYVIKEGLMRQGFFQVLAYRNRYHPGLFALPFIRLPDQRGYYYEFWFTEAGQDLFSQYFGDGTEYLKAGEVIEKITVESLEGEVCYQDQYQVALKQENPQFQAVKRLVTNL